MKTLPRHTDRVDLGGEVSPEAVCRELRKEQDCSLWIDGAGSFDGGWPGGSLVAVDPSLHARIRADSNPSVDRALADLGRRVTRRREAGSSAATGVAVLASYELLNDGAGSPLPDLVVLEVNRSVHFDREGGASLVRRGPAGPLDDRVERIASATGIRREPLAAARIRGRPTTSLPRERYLEAVAEVKRHIERGDIYQANLCQRFDVELTGDAYEAYLALRRSTPAPRSAFIETPELVLASVSPEIFVDERSPGIVETWPIKGTRPRGGSVEADRASAAELCGSVKDRAELLMIVDLERNDLSRVCRAGSVVVPELAALESYAAVHHLVACVRGRLKDGVELADLIRATFPGGSITGAPKRRAIEILRELEPVRRGYFTGSLFWFGDDGSMASSILIRSWTFAAGRGQLGAGGGIVADSEPELEWHESNHKARALAAALGFDPEEAG